jgi:hypothetical protein
MVAVDSATSQTYMPTEETADGSKRVKVTGRVNDYIQASPVASTGSWTHLTMARLPALWCGSYWCQFDGHQRMMVRFLLVN